MLVISNRFHNHQGCHAFDSIVELVLPKHVANTAHQEVRPVRMLHTMAVPVVINHVEAVLEGDHVKTWVERVTRHGKHGNTARAGWVSSGVLFFGQVRVELCLLKLVYAFVLAVLYLQQFVLQILDFSVRLNINKEACKYICFDFKTSKGLDLIVCVSRSQQWFF